MELSRLRESFLSKAITATSIASLFIANSGSALSAIGINTTSLSQSFLGGLLFLLGYILYGFRVPQEFKIPGEIHEIVSRMQVLSDEDFFKSRVHVAENLLARMAGYSWAAPVGSVEFLSGSLPSAGLQRVGATPLTARLFQADINLRRFDRPFSRIFVAVLMFGGIGLLAWPTLRNVVAASLTVSGFAQ